MKHLQMNNSPMIPPVMSEVLRDIIVDPSNEPFEPLAPAAEQVSNVNRWTDPDSLPLEEPLEAYIARDPYPLPSISDREGYHDQDRHFDWWLSGLADFLATCEQFRRHTGHSLGEGHQILELGCASGRILRHFACQSKAARVCGCDINLRHIEWIRMFLPPSIRILQNTILPNLPFEDRSFDLICAFSVFTHVDHLELAWLAEIRRVLKLGGIAYLSIHGEATWSIMRPGVPVYDALMSKRKRIKGCKVDDRLFSGPIPHPKTIFAWESVRNYNTNVFHTTDYINNAWGRFLKVLEIIPGGHGYQDVVVLQKVD